MARIHIEHLFRFYCYRFRRKLLLEDPRTDIEMIIGLPVLASHTPPRLRFLLAKAATNIYVLFSTQSK